jgi:beta-aspartyl-peptidase (threonine type)
VRALVVHGGAGVIAAEASGRQQRACEEALDIGWAILADGGSALDAVERAVVHLEDDPALNAGYGACLTDTGGVELDASIMEGATSRAGAVALITRVRNPIVLARSLLEHGPHVFMAGSAAEEIAAARGFALVSPADLITPERRSAWELRSRTGQGAASSPPDAGTVGAVALDAHGHTAAATSTGGVAWKRPGRIGDSAVIGAGTVADDDAGAVSSTGLGEAILRAGLARVALEHMRDGLAPERAAHRALARVTAVGGSAGVILVDPFGRMAAVHTTPHMTSCSRRG